MCADRTHDALGQVRFNTGNMMSGWWWYMDHIRPWREIAEMRRKRVRNSIRLGWGDPFEYGYGGAGGRDCQIWPSGLVAGAQ
jgi:hypothetical protein